LEGRPLIDDRLRTGKSSVTRPTPHSAWVLDRNAGKETKKDSLEKLYLKWFFKLGEEFSLNMCHRFQRASRNF